MDLMQSEWWDVGIINEVRESIKAWGQSSRICSSSIVDLESKRTVIEKRAAFEPLAGIKTRADEDIESKASNERRAVTENGTNIEKRTVIEPLANLGGRAGVECMVAVESLVSYENG